jgi:hypothetical protein
MQILAAPFLSAVAGDYESIATTTVGAGGQTTVTFSGIPATYKHLQLRIISRGNFAANSYSTIMRFNSDSGTNYSYHRLGGDGSSASVTGSYPQANVFFSSAGTNVANAFAPAIIDILDYANTNKYKTTRILGGIDFNGSGTVELLSSSWSNTSAITTIALSTGGFGDWLQYSSFALYGIKG